MADRRGERSLGTRSLGIRGLAARNGAGARLAACSALVVLAGPTLTAAAAPAAGGSIVVTYTTPTSLQVSLGDGTAVGSGSTIPAGSYMVTVKDDPNTGDLNPQFTINGPGVSLSNNLDSSGMGIDATSTFGPYTLATSSSYTIEDAIIGSSTLVSFMTSSSSSSSGTSTSPAATPPPASTTSSTSGTSGSKTSTTSTQGSSSSRARSCTRRSRRRSARSRS